MIEFVLTLFLAAGALWLLVNIYEIRSKSRVQESRTGKPQVLYDDITVWLHSRKHDKECVIHDLSKAQENGIAFILMTGPTVIDDNKIHVFRHQKIVENCEGYVYWDL